MSDGSDLASDDGDTPRIVVLFAGAEPAVVERVERGIEEEGVPWSVASAEDEEESDDPTALAQRAASDSRLKIGVGVSENADLVLHHARLPAGEPLFSISDATDPEARTVGTNAARLAKRLPLKPID